MPLTVLGPTNSIPYATFPTLVQVKQNWGDDWQSVPGLTLEQCSHNAGANDLDEASFTWKYGNLAHPWDSDLTVYSPLDLDGEWVRVLLVSRTQQQTIWIGRILGQGKDVHGSDPGAPSGVQRWQAYGPQMILRKIHVTQSVWDKSALSGSDVEVDNFLDWSAPMNDRVGQQAQLIGNRSDRQVTPSFSAQQSYVFGGKNVWTAYDFLNYILTWWCDFSQQSPAGPLFKLGGQTAPLKNLKFAQEWPEVTTVDHILRTLISPRFGLDFSLEPTSDGNGFTVNVFSLQAQAVSSGGVTLPANPNTVTVQAGQTPANLKTVVAISSDHLVNKIRVLGKRIVVCCSLGGPDVDTGLEGITAAMQGMIGQAWDTGLETDYDAGTGPAPATNVYPAGSAERADFVRRSARFRDVYQLWLMSSSVDLDTISADVCVDDTGKPSNLKGDGSAPRQMVLRKTLHWLPLRSDYDYSSGWPGTQLTIDADPGYSPQYLMPLVWLWNDQDKWRLASQAGVHVVLPKFGLGVRLVSNPRHHVALGQFTATNTLHKPRWQASKMVATLAFESDARLSLSHTVSETDTDSCDGTEEIYVPDAEMWILAPNTNLAIDPADATGFITSPDQLTIVRDDRPRMAMLLAGAIARYAYVRARAEIEAAGICPWGGLVGQILTTVESGGDSTTVQAPITQVTWMNDPQLPRTTVRTGFANRE
jgi:hypothetical protein